LEAVFEWALYQKNLAADKRADLPCERLAARLSNRLNRRGRTGEERRRLVRTGNFGAEPADFPVRRFLGEVAQSHIKDMGHLTFSSIELRNHRGETIDPSLAMRIVRDMEGARGEHSDRWHEEYDVIFDIESDIESALEIFDDDPRLATDLTRDLFLKGLMYYIIGRFSMDALDHVLEFYQREIERARAEEK
jgi:hypothetical protein